MQITDLKTEGLTREFKIAVPASDIAEKTTRRLEEMARTANLPGFRPGKVPVSLLRKRFGKALLGETLEQVVNESTGALLNERRLRTAGEPRIEITSAELDADLEYTVAVDILPEISQPDYSQIVLERPVAKAEEGDVDKTLEGIAGMVGSNATLAEKRPARADDVVVIDFVGRIDGEEFAGGRADDYELTLGSGAFIPGFEDQLIGAESGETRDVTVDFPEEYGAAELAGKTAVFEVTVKDIREVVAAAVDDELAKKLGKETVGALRDDVAERRDHELKAMSRLAVKRSLLDSLETMYDFDVPPSMVDREYASIVDQLKAERKTAGEGEEAYFAKDGGDDDDHDHDHDHDQDQDHAGASAIDDAVLSDSEKTEYRTLAQRRVRLGLVLAEVGQINSLQVTPDEIRRAMYAEAARWPGQERAVLDFYEKQPQAVEALAGPILEDKVVDFMLEMSTVNDRDVSPEELRKIVEEGRDLRVGDVPNEADGAATDT